MNISYFNIALDIKETQSQVSIPMKRGCTNYGVRITLVDGNKPYNITKECIALFSATKPDGAIIENNCTINKNKINYKVTDQTVAASGVLDCAIMLYGADEELLASAHFTIVVDERAVGDVPVSEDEKNFFDSMVASEIARRESEEERIKAEEGRVTAEAQRVEAENGRVEAEALRDTDELSRNTAEEGRVTAEAQRVKAENGRVSAEKSRVIRFSEMESDMEEHLEDLDSRYRLGTQEMVNKWLAEHPEATTTVQDHSLFLDAFVFGELGYVTPQMFKGRYDEDDTSSIQYALDFAHENNIGVVYIPAGTYWIEATGGMDTVAGAVACGLAIHSNTKVIMDKNAVLKVIPNGARRYCVLRCESDAENIEITGGQIHGDRNEHVPNDPNYLGEQGHAIYLGGNKNVKISDCIIKDTWGDGILVEANSTNTARASNILIDNVIVDNVRRNGISLVGVIGCTISNSTISNTNGTSPQFGIDIEPSPYKDYDICKDENILITNCKIKGNAKSGIGSVGYTRVYNQDKENEYSVTVTSDNITVTDCVFEGNYEGVTFGSISNVTVANSSFKENVRNGISISNVDGFKVSNCHSSLNGNATDGGVGMSLGYNSSGVIEGCTFTKNKEAGIRINKCYGGVIIRSCIADGNGTIYDDDIANEVATKRTGSGFTTKTGTPPKTEEEIQAMNNANPIIFSDCISKNNTGGGIVLVYQPRSKVENCVLVNNNSYGVYVFNNSNDSVISNCYFEGNFVNNAAGNDLGCYGNSNSKIINNTFRVGNVAHTHSPMVIGYYNSTTENIFISENDFRGMSANIKEMTSGTGVVTTGTIYGKNIKIDGTYA